MRYKFVTVAFNLPFDSDSAGIYALDLAQKPFKQQFWRYRRLATIPTITG